MTTDERDRMFRLLGTCAAPAADLDWARDTFVRMADTIERNVGDIAALERRIEQLTDEGEDLACQVSDLEVQLDGAAA